MRNFSLLATVVVLLAGMPASAQTTAEGARVRVAGTIEELKSDVLTISAANGQKQSVTLSPDLQVYGVEKRRVADIKPGDFVASGGVCSPSNVCQLAHLDYYSLMRIS